MVKVSVLSALLLAVGCSGFVVKIDRHLIKSGSSSSDHSVKSDDASAADDYDYLSDRQLAGLLPALGTGLLGLLLPTVLQGFTNSSSLGGLLSGGLGGLLGGRYPMIGNFNQAFGYAPLADIPQNLQPYTVNIRGIGEAILLANPELMQQANSGPYQMFLKPSKDGSNTPGEKFLNFHKDKPHLTILPIAVPVPEHISYPQYPTHISTHIPVSGHGGHHGHRWTEEELEASEKRNEEESESHDDEKSSEATS